MKYRVEILPLAEFDVREILAWIQPRSPEGALAWRRSWLSAVAWLEDHADLSSQAPETEHHPFLVQYHLFKTKRGRNYRMLFTIREGTVYVLHVRGPGQDLVQSDELRSPPPSETP